MLIFGENLLISLGSQNIKTAAIAIIVTIKYSKVNKL